VRKCLAKWLFDGLAVTLTSDLLTSKSNQFIHVSKCTIVVTLMKFPQAVYKISYVLINL